MSKKGKWGLFARDGTCVFGFASKAEAIAAKEAYSNRFGRWKAKMVCPYHDWYPESRCLDCEREEARAAFDAAWERLSSQGMCDTCQGSEYMRVWDEWTIEGFGTPPLIFIAKRANIGSEPKT
jgi:hypothetical protein